MFRKVGECLYRYSSNGVYYARFKTDGKEIRRSLETTDPAEARRKLAAEKAKERQTDRSQGKLTLRELCDRWLKTIQNFKPKTLDQRSYIAARIKAHWLTDSLVQIAKIKASDSDMWLARCARKSRNGFSASSRNAQVQILEEVFALALRDRIISVSPAAYLKYVQRQKPIRLTPTWEQFKAIISNVRAQVFNVDAQATKRIAQPKAATCDLCDAEGNRSSPKPMCAASCPHQAASRMTGPELLQAVMQRPDQHFAPDASVF